MPFPQLPRERVLAVLQPERCTHSSWLTARAYNAPPTRANRINRHHPLRKRGQNLRGVFQQALTRGRSVADGDHHPTHQRWRTGRSDCESDE